MTFYGIDYLERQSNINDYLKYLIIFGSLLILILVFSLYMRHRIQTKYRDLSIIFFLILMFALGVQYTDYRSNQTKHSQSSQMVNFVKRLAAQEKVDSKEIFVNATQFSDGIIVKIDKKYFKVTLSNDQSSYTLTESYLIDKNVNYTK
ncbi:DUF3290 domain-containing protein [Enterococcus hermanniensis]|uniref:DUF3290 domain-containing protein n=1 Tax=Enterococcus hermanniensis TaxID=249189 RepID=A0A1L8TQ09_9ENTE|nr:DUF3290 domain-containing protein [Enterococcus hermanniensis]OJG46409.1 hypothetical protein RV04_GL000837 [Enterococcus hermanniensis]